MKKLISCLLIIAVVFSMCSCLSLTSFAASKSYYFDSVNGDDGVWINSESKPYKSLSKLNSKSFSSGSTVYIKRGSVYRGQLVTQENVTYTAYGEGNAPLFLGSDDAHNNNWQLTGYSNVWVYNQSIEDDIGNIIFNDGERWGYKQIAGVNGFSGSLSDLDSDLEFYHNTDGKVYLYSVTNPYSRFSSIELAKKVASSSNKDIQHLIVLKSGVTIDGFCLKYCGNHAIQGTTVNNIIIKNCEIGWIGGSILSGTTRYGNAIEFWDNCSNIQILNNRMYQIYDTGVTLQCTEARIFSNVTVTGNTIDYCTFSFEYYLPEGGKFKDITVSGNTFSYAGYGWGEQRPDKEYTAHINSWNFYANPSENFTFTNNIFNGSTKTVFIADSSAVNNVTLSGNTYKQCDYCGDSCASPQLLTWYQGTKYKFGSAEAESIMNTLDSSAQFGYCPLPIDYPKVCSLVEAVFGNTTPNAENLAKRYDTTEYTSLYELMGFGENWGLVDYYYAIKNQYSVNWDYANSFIKNNEAQILSLASQAVKSNYEISFDNEFDFDAYNWNGVWSAQSEVDYETDSYTLKNINGDAQNNTYNGDYCGGKVSGAMNLVSGHTYRLSYSYKNNTALDGVQGNIRLFGFNNAQCTGSMYTINPVDNSNPTWTASANQGGTYTYDVKIPEQYNCITVRCNAFNCIGASVTFSDIYICDITNGLPVPSIHKKTVEDGSAAGTLPQLSSEKFNFTGWCCGRASDGNGTGDEITANTVITSNKRVFSRWELKSCTVTVNTNGGLCNGITYNKAEAGKMTATKVTDCTVDNSSVLTVEYGTNIILPIPTKKGYVFTGWKCGNSVLPQGTDGNTELAVSSDTTISAIWEKEEEFIYGLYAGITQSEFIEKYVDTAKYSVLCSTEKVGTDTLFTVTDKATGEIYKKYRVVIFGDVNGDGWYDGTDAVVVSLIAEGMLDSGQVSKAVLTAADCNQDGTVNSSDVLLLEEAGILLADIDQTKSADELLKTSSEYIEYINLIEQEVNSKPAESDTDKNPFTSLIGFISDIIAFVKALVAFISNGMPGLPFGK